jgi:hypothetical protein
MRLRAKPVPAGAKAPPSSGDGGMGFSRKYLTLVS